MTDIEAKITITHHVIGQGGKYVARIDGENAAGTLEWEPGESDDVRIATHTIVPAEIGGRGIAAMLVDRQIADARRLGFKIVPQCSYVAAKFDQNPDWADLKA